MGVAAELTEHRKGFIPISGFAEDAHIVAFGLEHEGICGYKYLVRLQITVERLTFVAGQELRNFLPWNVVGVCFFLILGGLHCEGDVQA